MKVGLRAYETAIRRVHHFASAKPDAFQGAEGYAEAAALSKLAVEFANVLAGGTTAPDSALSIPSDLSQLCGRGTGAAGLPLAEASAGWHRRGPVVAVRRARTWSC